MEFGREKYVLFIKVSSFHWMSQEQLGTKEVFDLLQKGLGIEDIYI